jgi:glycosyltransferase involved in cell wall biosynthesis
MVYWARLGSHPATIWLKYLGQALQTWVLLLREQPEAIFVMSPPIVAGLVVYPYCALRRVPFVVDAHTGAFQNPRWRHFRRLQFWLCRRAATTIVSNANLAETLGANGADATILPDVPVEYPPSDVSYKRDRFLVVAVCSFDRDEPIEVVLDAARALPQVQFLITGKPKSRDVTSSLPSNATLTGFLEATAFGQLLRDADAVVALTTGNQTMLRGAYEAIYHGTPVIISNSELLRQEFPSGAILIENRPDSLVSAVQRMSAEAERYRKEAATLRRAKLRRWISNRELLKTKLNRSLDDLVARG